MSFKTGKFPNKMKLAKIIYQFICPKRLLSFLSSNNSISDSQYDFTSYAIADATSYVTSILDNSYFIMGTFSELRHIGSLYFDFKNLIFMVYVGNMKSHENNIVCGVPQGSVL